MGTPAAGFPDFSSEWVQWVRVEGQEGQNGREQRERKKGKEEQTGRGERERKKERLTHTQNQRLQRARIDFIIRPFRPSGLALGTEVRTFNLGILTPKYNFIVARI